MGNSIWASDFSSSLRTNWLTSDCDGGCGFLIISLLLLLLVVVVFVLLFILFIIFGVGESWPVNNGLLLFVDILLIGELLLFKRLLLITAADCGFVIFGNGELFIDLLGGND